MLLSKWILLIVCFLSFGIRTQINFQKIYLFEDTFAIFNDIYVTDSCYYYTCTSGKAYQREFFNFGKIHLDGTEETLLLDQDVTSLQQVMFSQSDMDTNFRGNFVTSFRNSSLFGTVPRVKEFSKNGNLISDYTFNNYWLNDSLYFFNSNRIILSNNDSVYYLFTHKYDYTTDDNTIYKNGSQGCILIKIKYDGAILLEKEYNFLPIGINKPQWAVLNFLKYSTTSYLLVIAEQSLNGPSNAQLDWAKIHFIEIDENGNEIKHEIFQDGQYSPGNYAATLLPDGGLILSYYESILGGVVPNGDYFKPRPVIARLDNNFDLVWKQNIRELFGSGFGYYDNMNDVKIVDDSLFVGAFKHVDELIFNQAYKTRLRLSQYNLDGVNKWNRDYIYFPTDDFNDPEYGIYDFELTPDGGYILVGEIFHFDSLSAGAPGQFGYVLKTNCLGFLGDPQAQFAFEVDDLSVTFINESVQAGSYTWILGTGDTIVTSENVNTLLYQYPSYGEFNVQLIAHGCNNVNDNINYTIETKIKDNDSGIVGDGTLLTIYPNPVSQGESITFYVGSIPKGDAKIAITNEIGEMLFNGSLSGDNKTYILSMHFASGVYFVSLMMDGKRLEVEKLVVR